MTWEGYVAFTALSVVTFAISRDFRGVATRMHKWGRDYWEPRGVRYTSLRTIRLWNAVLAGFFIALIIISIAQAAGLARK
jgi:hypothetical protein